MANQVQETTNSVNKSAFKTSFSEHTYDFKWEIENFPKWPRNNTEKTSTFHPELNRDFYAILQTLESGWCHLSFVLENGPAILIEHNVSVTNASGKVPDRALSAFVPTKSHLHQLSSSRACMFKFYVSELENFCQVSGINDLVFQCTMKIIGLKTEIASPKQVEECANIQPTEEDRSLPEESTDNLSILVDNLKDMFINSKDTDVTLHIDGQCVTAHKSILKARSPVFEELLSNNAEDLTISDIKMPVLKDLLLFLYTGKLNNENNFESVFELYQAAFLYDVHSLLETCASILLLGLEINNACRLLSLADNHHDENFCAKLLDFFLLHYNEIVDTKEWDQLVENPIHFKLVAKVNKSVSKMGKK